ncbi:uncharacterized protein GGS22DRAFT_151577 [Annulohypoxylon maeteangense]|uniref:uncharacterized protein n=1 Tax=Annulohypoxylon maeteangense TaxID=1927788 RepID=UPI002008572C|nr:uncharacterized protein GGS22DRAFT_151577 [Annulohypoxylon maeteangense]KAI0890680.1 hypothetical protein GGS22DRAFT_151577 [Annulohypoxylon maeteangense]
MASQFNLTALRGTPLEQLETTPLMAPPPGFHSNFINPPSQSTRILIITGITVPLIFIFAGLRIYVRIMINGVFTMDDHLCILSAFLSMAYTGLTLAMLDTPGKGPAGPHMWDVPLIRITDNYLRETLATSCLFAIASTTVKTSILIFFARLFGRFRSARLMSWSGTVIVTLFYTAWIIPSLPLCVTNLSTSQTCSKFISDMSLAHGIFSTFSDFYILFIPIYMISHIQLSPRKQYGAIGIFLTGLAYTLRFPEPYIF